ncbi:FecR domain-containing protein [Pseudomonas sp. NPDC089734]|uniref:FecR domain-containing protein n=1 Tax=Pseudomonas sp. NPDC089734 TaxID=3364469 RepID=UPI00380CA8BF
MSPKHAPIDRKIASQAASWFVRLQATTATEQDHEACAQWRRSHSDHERAWQLAARFNEQLHTIPPSLGRSTLYRPTPMSRRTAVKALTSLVLLGSLGIAASRTSTVASLTADISTRTGERRKVTLVDGTEVHLNTDTALDIRYTDTARTLVLRKGEVFIQTAKDDPRLARPFMLESARGFFQPLGTRFSVRQFDDHDQLKVIEGTVAATPRETPAHRTEIQAGQQADMTGQRVTPLPGSPSTIDWVEGVLRVDRMRLADFVNELGRYRQGWTRCEPDVADLRISGAFQLQDIDSVLAAVAMTLPVRVRYVTRYWVTLSAV